MSIALHVPSAAHTFRVPASTCTATPIGLSGTSTTATTSSVTVFAGTPCVPAYQPPRTPSFAFGKFVAPRVTSTPPPVRSSTMHTTVNANMARPEATLHISRLPSAACHDSEHHFRVAERQSHFRDVVDRVKHDLRDALSGGVLSADFGAGDRKELVAAAGRSNCHEADQAAQIATQAGLLPGAMGSVTLPMASPVGLVQRSMTGPMGVGVLAPSATPKCMARSPSPVGSQERSNREASPLRLQSSHCCSQLSSGGSLVFPANGAVGSLQMPMFARSGAQAPAGSSCLSSRVAAIRETSPRQISVRDYAGSAALLPVASSVSRLAAQHGSYVEASPRESGPLWTKTPDGWYAHRDRSGSPQQSSFRSPPELRRYHESFLVDVGDDLQNGLGVDEAAMSCLTRGSTTHSLAHSQCTFVVARSGSTSDLDAQGDGFDGNDCDSPGPSIMCDLSQGLGPFAKELDARPSLASSPQDTGKQFSSGFDSPETLSEKLSMLASGVSHAEIASTPPKQGRECENEIQPESPLTMSWRANYKRSSSSAVSCAGSQQSSPSHRNAKHRNSGSGTPMKQRTSAVMSPQSTHSPRTQTPRGPLLRAQPARTSDRKGSIGRRSESAPKIHSPRSSASPRASLKPQDPTLQLRLSMAMMAEEHGMAPGAADKWKVLQIFYDTIPRSEARIERIDRVTRQSEFSQFLDGRSPEDCDLGFYSPLDTSQVARLRDRGFSADDFEEIVGQGMGVPVASHFGAALQCARSPSTVSGCVGKRCLCVVLCHSLRANPSSAQSSSTGSWREYCVKHPGELLLAYVVWFHQISGDSDGQVHDSIDERDRSRRGSKKKRLDKESQLKEYAKVRDPLIKVAMQGLGRVPAGTMRTVLLPTSSVEAESVVSLYLLGGGGARVHRPPGVDPREALGGVVVQRIENQLLYKAYSALGEGESKYREDVVWHGTRIKRMDGEGASLATKLQSIAEKGFDPHRCMKGAAAEGGIWVATSPLGSFGHSGDGLVAFVLCLVKTHFNEWVDANCARVLQRERVLPLYSLVHA